MLWSEEFFFLLKCCIGFGKERESKETKGKPGNVGQQRKGRKRKEIFDSIGFPSILEC